MNPKPHRQLDPALEPASFRDPNGFLFTHQGVLYRQINPVYQADYRLLNSSGLYHRLVKDGLLIPHQQVSPKTFKLSSAHTVIKPQLINFISYPYELSFSQLKDAAMITLKLQQLALEHGMSLKDASAYNIQFHQGKPLLIDTLSFESYDQTKPWVAYRQFCQHFLAPLALMAHTDIRLGQLLRVYIDGIPLDLASRLLPKTSYLNPGLTTHLHLHAGSQSKYAADTQAAQKTRLKMTKTGMLGLIDHLLSTISKLKWQHSPQDSQWGDYYTFTNYSRQAFKLKQQIITAWLDQIKPQSLWDLGANDGRFSRLASDRHIHTLAFDIDPIAVEANYLMVRHHQEAHLLPLLLDLTNPSPAIGWANTERKTLAQRGPADMVFALALVHHLAISNNLPFDHLSDFLASICKHLIIEFVPKTDSQVQKLLATREDIFPDYDLDHFTQSLSRHFRLCSTRAIKGSQRTLLLFSRQ